MTSPAALLNPFPGLRPFEPEEDHLFFGREQEIDELLRRLRFHRFLSVVGTSGCGKSSLIRCGLIPSLHSGLMVRAGSSWRVSIFRPGEDPIGHLAAALDSPEVIGATDQELAATSRVLVEAALRRGSRGLVEAVRLARIPPHDNVLVVVDQFEELFRFQQSRQSPHSRDEAVVFVKLLLEAVSQETVPIYVVITMRSDFIGDCMEYAGLPEALNASQYLVRRMRRDELRSAITGPVAVAGAAIEPRLVLRLLNDVGNDQDQLPVLQHALMRTWDHWAGRAGPGDPLDIGDYEAVGTLDEALSRHAEEAYAETASRGWSRVTERMFKALTDTVTDPRGTRRPCSVAELAAVAETSEAEVIEVIEIFRRPGRSFLMPSMPLPLDSRAVVDLSHESLMRGWTRLIQWADEERASAAVYIRVTKAAAWFEEGSAGLWRDPELELGLKWRRESHPTAAWARRYGEPFERAIHFLDRSAHERDRLVAERRAEKRRQWRQLQWTAVLLAVLLVAAGTLAYVASREGARARRENARAEDNLRLARAAVDASLSVAERPPSRLAVDLPEIVGLRRQLLEQAQRFYSEFVKQAPEDEAIRREMAFAHLRLAHIDRALERGELAGDRYRQAIEQFDRLVRDAPGQAEYRQALANALNWLGETLTSAPDHYVAAKEAYGRALGLQRDLMREWPDAPMYRQDLARTSYNRGILYAGNPDRETNAARLAESDFRTAIDLLEPLAATGTHPSAAQELGRAHNNLGSLLNDLERLPEARESYGRAVEIHQQLLQQEPVNREYALELVKFHNNLADLLREQTQFDQARDHNRRALDLIQALSRPAPSLWIQRADTHTLRGLILQAQDPAAALGEYRQAFEIFRSVEQHEQAMRFPDFHLRFGDLIVNLAYVVRDRPGSPQARDLLAETIAFYLMLAKRTTDTGTPGEARSILETWEHVLPVLPEAERTSAGGLFRQIEPALQRTATEAPAAGAGPGRNQ